MFNKIRLFSAFAILLTILTVNGFAGFDPPPNDNFANAQILTGSSGLSTAVDNLYGTREPGESEHGRDRGRASVWYKFVAPSTGVMSINTGPSNFDTVLAVYEGTSWSNLVLVTQNDDIYSTSISCVCSLVTFGAVQGKTYYIAVDGRGGSSGNTVVSYSLTNSVVANDNFANAFVLPNATGRMYTSTNLGASKEAGEPDHAGNVGGRSVWFKWTAPAGAQKFYDFSIDARPLAGSATPLFAIYSGSSLANLTQIGKGEQARRSRIVFKPIPGATYYIAIDGTNVGGSAQLLNVVLDYHVFHSDKIADLDADGVADLATYRWYGRWYWRRSGMYPSGYDLVSLDWGTAGDIPLLSDWNGDGVQDFMVFRPSNGTWWNRSYDSSPISAVQWGVNGDIPLAYESHVPQSGINSSVPLIFRPSTGVWYRYQGVASDLTQWGLPGDVPLTADFTGDGVDDITVFRPSTGVWYIRDGFYGGLYKAVQFGQAGDVPVIADYDADFVPDIAVYRRTTGTWYVLRSSDGGFQAVQWGSATDTPQAGDFDGDGKADYTVFRTGRWFILQSGSGYLRQEYFGVTDDVPVTVPRY